MELGTGSEIVLSNNMFLPPQLQLGSGARSGISVMWNDAPSSCSRYVVTVSAMVHLDWVVCCLNLEYLSIYHRSSLDLPSYTNTAFRPASHDLCTMETVAVAATAAAASPSSSLLTHSPQSSVRLFSNGGSTSGQVLAPACLPATRPYHCLLKPSDPPIYYLPSLE